MAKMLYAAALVNEGAMRRHGRACPCCMPVSPTDRTGRAIYVRRQRRIERRTWSTDYTD